MEKLSSFFLHMCQKITQHCKRSALVFLARPHQTPPTTSDTEVWMQYRLGLADGDYVCHAARLIFTWKDGLERFFSKRAFKTTSKLRSQRFCHGCGRSITRIAFKARKLHVASGDLGSGSSHSSSGWCWSWRLTGGWASGGATAVSLVDE